MLYKGYTGLQGYLGFRAYDLGFGDTGESNGQEHGKCHGNWGVYRWILGTLAGSLEYRIVYIGSPIWGNYHDMGLNPKLRFGC